MTHLYTKGGEYSLLALQAMAEEPNRVWAVSDICQKADIPEHFTRKVLRLLVEAGLLDSTRGPGGGFSFAKAPSKVSLAQVIRIIDSRPRFDRCILGFEQCNEKDPCALHYMWSPIKALALNMLEERTIADLALAPAVPKRGRKKSAKRSSKRSKRPRRKQA